MTFEVQSQRPARPLLRTMRQRRIRIGVRRYPSVSGSTIGASAVLTPVAFAIPELCTQTPALRTPRVLIVEKEDPVVARTNLQVPGGGESGSTDIRELLLCF